MENSIATLKQLKSAAKKIGARVVDTKVYGTHECTVEAPHGYCWEPGLHQFVDCTNVPWKPDYTDLLNRMRFGMEICTDPECDWCHPVGE